MTHDDLFFFTNTGKVFQSKAYEIPVSSRTAKGQAIVNFLQIAPGEKITAVITVWKRKPGQISFHDDKTRHGEKNEQSKILRKSAAPG